MIISNNNFFRCCQCSRHTWKGKLAVYDNRSNAQAAARGVCQGRYACQQFVGDGKSLQVKWEWEGRMNWGAGIRRVGGLLSASLLPLSSSAIPSTTVLAPERDADKLLTAAILSRQCFSEYHNSKCPIQYIKQPWFQPPISSLAVAAVWQCGAMWWRVFIPCWFPHQCPLYGHTHGTILWLLGAPCHRHQQ